MAFKIRKLSPTHTHTHEHTLPSTACVAIMHTYPHTRTQTHTRIIVATSWLSVGTLMVIFTHKRSCISIF